MTETVYFLQSLSSCGKFGGVLPSFRQQKSNVYQNSIEYLSPLKSQMSVKIQFNICPPLKAQMSVKILLDICPHPHSRELAIVGAKCQYFASIFPPSTLFLSERA